MWIFRPSKLHWKKDVEITWIFRPAKLHRKKLRGNHVDFSTNEITSKKVSGNHVNFSTSKITSKKYAEMTWKFVEIWSSTYDVISTANRRGFDVVCPLGGKYGVISLVSVFPSRVMVLKLPKKGFCFCNFVLTSASILKQFTYIYLKGLVMHFQKMVLFIILYFIVPEILGLNSKNFV